MTRLPSRTFRQSEAGSAPAEQHNYARITPPKGRQVMPHEGVKPQKHKGSDERS
jgi:hypothetical protein